MEEVHYSKYKNAWVYHALTEKQWWYIRITKWNDKLIHLWHAESKGMRYGEKKI